MYQTTIPAWNPSNYSPNRKPHSPNQIEEPGEFPFRSYIDPDDMNWDYEPTPDSVPTFH
ncbi:hypothetical protein [Gulbenkiania mobilis]|uniref:hypothetical protein n=1 Tax=Gulbenkiania mobilis TaxID=397457 RepID=UPI0013791415|nr:hypothetical protein [Gulbenkiania mobilis]